jgi:hypothetical protein
MSLTLLLIVSQSVLKRDGADLVGIITDHGHRAGRDNFVIVIVWSGFDTEMIPTYKLSSAPVLIQRVTQQ